MAMKNIFDRFISTGLCMHVENGVALLSAPWCDDIINNNDGIDERKKN